MVGSQFSFGRTHAAAHRSGITNPRVDHSGAFTLRDNIDMALRPSEEKTLSAIEGVNVVMVGPRRPSGHEVDLAATLELIDFHNSTGVKGVAVLGTTAEFVHLDFEERTRLIPLAVKRAKIPVVVGVTHSTLDGSVLLGRAAAEAGAAAAA